MYAPPTRWIAALRRPPSIALIAILAAVFMPLSGTSAYAAVNAIDNIRMHPAIPLLDEQGVHVKDSGKPYSPRKSCGEGSGCHDYDKITHAWHFEMGREETSDAYGVKRKQPHLVGPGYFGGFTCVGGNNALILSKKDNPSAEEFLDYGAAGIIKTCELCHAGGGWSEFDRNGVRYDAMPENKIKPFDGDYYERAVNASTPPQGHETHGSTVRGNGIGRWDWQRSGVIEADCIICHVDVNAFKAFPGSKFSAADLKKKPIDLQQDLRNNKLTKGDFFRYVDSAVFEFLNILPNDPTGKSLLTFERKYATPAAAYELVLDANGFPKMTWNAQAFNADGKVELPMIRFPVSEACMLCHWTSNSRRGFWGFGEEARETFGEHGIMVRDYRDDVHKGKTWTEPNGESRVMENCNVCHARNYFKPSYANVDIDANHDWLKGHTDMDARNDLDFDAEPKTCEYCHQDASTKIIPSGQSTLMAAHRELWVVKGDMDGYPREETNRITQTHLDRVSCEACHITRLEYPAGTPLPPYFRYREDGTGALKIFPYRPSVRYQWHDRTSGRVISNTEYKTVVKQLTDSAGKPYGAIVDPISGQEMAKVAVTTVGTRVLLGEPATYEAWVALKKALDNLLIKKGYSNPNIRLVWGESNEYIITHNTRPSPDALQCDSCHAKRTTGEFSPLLSETGLLGTKNVRTVAKVLDKRLVDEGIIELGLPYMKLDDKNNITETASDILEVTKKNPSMSMFNLAIARQFTGEWKRRPTAESLQKADLAGTAAQSVAISELGADEAFVFDVRIADDVLRQVALLAEVNKVSAALLPAQRLDLEVETIGAADRSTVLNQGLGALGADAFRLKVVDRQNRPVTSLTSQRVLVKLPYNGTKTTPGQIRVLSRNGGSWADSGLSLLAVNPPANGKGGFVLFAISQPFDALALADNAPAPVAPPTSTDAGSTTGGSTGGGSVNTPAPSCDSKQCKKALVAARKAWQARQQQAARLQKAANVAAARVARAKTPSKLARAQAAAAAAQQKAANAQAVAAAAYSAMIATTD